ncbi:sensor histidine kinase [Romboutsia weinsteinii]|uniref:histidine kinase n=2 Tax=Romboutsia weinsteinii TaxID=2020949 RepID=A0A371JA80_9FIRM|nr:sensor histidine kinase [Romboutsia weinsteinii]
MDSEVSEKMLIKILRNIKNDSVIKKIVAMSCALMILTSLLFVFFEYGRVKKMYVNQVEIMQTIVGNLAEKYPQDESDIVKSIYTLDVANKEKGEKILNKYGYSIKNSMENDESFIETLKQSINSGLIVLITLIVSISIIIYNFIKYIIRQVSILELKIEEMVKEDYLKESELGKEYNFEEGIFSRIDNSINELKKSLKIKFVKSEKEKESIKSLVTDISHQLKTPLASLRLYNTLLIEEDLDKEEKMEFLITNKHSIDKLHSLIDALVNLSRLEVSMISIKREDNNIKDTILRAIEGIKHKARDKKIKITVDNIKDKNISYDKKWTEESIFNILDNAVKYTEECGEIKINTEEAISYYKINIEDNGIGIDKKDYNNIFKRFYRASNSYVENTEGSGVGLYLSRRILEEQGGNIVVSSQPKKGTKFCLLLTTL